MNVRTPEAVEVVQGGTAARHAFTPRRIVALAVIAAAVIGLVYLRFAPGPARPTVPPGAQAGDLALQPCTYPTESGAYAAECGTLIVPENSANSTSRLIALPLTRVKAIASNPGYPIFYLEGGPGMSNLRLREASRFATDRDVVFVGYRGVDGSVRLDCPEVAAALKHSPDLLGDKYFRVYGDAYRACADRLTAAGVDLSMYGLPRQVEDLEAARVALGYARINLLSQSAGTRTAMIYAWRHPERIHRSVMIGVNPPGHFVADAWMMDEQIGRYAELCAQDPNCRTRTDDLAATLRRTAANMPERWLLLPINASNVRVMTFFGLMDSTPMLAPPSAPLTLDAWLTAAEGDASGLWVQSLTGDFFPWPFAWGQYATAAHIDAPVARDFFSAPGQDRNNFGWVGSAFSWAGGELTDAWPTAADEDAYSQIRTSDVETLLISGALDTSTPPQSATGELLPYLPNGHQVVLAGFGHIASFFTDQPEAGTTLINTFLASGRVDDSQYEPQPFDFTPDTTLPTIAKRVAGTMAGLALLTVLSLVLMARRVYRRGRFGPKSSALLRSVYPIVLGLGGWFLGGLVAMATIPGVRLDDQLVVVLSAATPSGLGIYFAWVHRDWSATTRSTGVAAALGGALVGGWLGFNATGGLVSVMTAIVGAVAGANLTLLALDVWWDRQARDRFVDASAKATPQTLTPQPTPTAGATAPQ